MKKTQKAQGQEIKVVMNEEQVKQEALRVRAEALKKIDKGGKEHTKRYTHLYKGTLATLKALLAEGQDLAYNVDKPKDANNLRIAELVVKKGFVLGHLVKFPNSVKADKYSSDTFQDVLRELFTDTRGRREGINQLLGEDVGDIFLKCSAIAKQKYFRTISKEENDAMNDINKLEADA